MEIYQIVILIIIGGFALFEQSRFQVGNIHMSLPNGYHADTHNDGVVNLRNFRIID